MVRPECQEILNTIADLESDRVQFQLDLHQARTYEDRQRISAEIKQITSRIGDLSREFDECEGRTPLPNPIGALFPSRVFVATNNSSFPGLGPAAAAAGMFFSQANYASVVFTFPDSAIGTFPFTIFGKTVVSNVLSAQLVSGGSGSFERSTGHVDIPSATFLVHHSIGLIASSTVVFTPLTTRTVPSSLSILGSLSGLPLTGGANPGRVVLVGSSTLMGGNFGGTVVDLIIDGKLSQFPPP